MNTKTSIKYNIQFDKDFDDIFSAQEAQQELNQAYPQLPKNRISYFMPQPVYKNGVPRWLIKLITK